MKQIITIVLIMIALGGLAQNKKYINAMKKTILLLDSAKIPEEHIKLADYFAKLSKAEKKDWLPLYYQGLCYTLAAFQKEGSEVDPLCDKAEVCLKKADSLSKNNSEIYVVKGMCNTARMVADPVSRYMQYGSAAYQDQLKAIELNPDNPRIYAFRGQSLYFTPEMFGGGCTKAKPHLEKAVEKFKIHKEPSEIHPHWGKRLSEKLLKECENN